MAFVIAMAVPAPAGAAPQGQLTWAVHVSIAPAWFDPADIPGIATPSMILYALHDALVKPMPGAFNTASLAESWTVSKDGLTYEFVLRKGVKFHNGEPVTAEDVKFSFDRYRGTGNAQYKANVASVQVVDTHRVRFTMKRPWPDFLTFYGTPATGAGWIVPKKYVEKIGEEAFKKQPIGAGPYRFVSFTPGVELVLEAFEQYWRKAPHVKRLVMKSVPEESTRLAMLKRGEADIAYSIKGALAEEVKNTPGLRLVPAGVPFTQFLNLADQWDPKSPWADRRVRLAANLAVDRQGLNQAETLGFGKPTANIVPLNMEFAWQTPVYPHDPKKARQLLGEAGFPNGFDAGEVSADAVYAPIAEAAVNDFRGIGIRTRLRAMERAGFFSQYREKKLKNVILTGSAAFGNAATRIEAFVSGGIYAYGSVPEIDALYKDQADEMDRAKREAMLHQIQQIMHERAMFVPLLMLPNINGVGPRVEAHGINVIPNFAYTGPYEDLKLKPSAK